MGDRPSDQMSAFVSHSRQCPVGSGAIVSGACKRGRSGEEHIDAAEAATYHVSVSDDLVSNTTQKERAETTHSIVPVCPVRSRLRCSISSDVPKSEIIALGLQFQGG